MEGTPAPSGYTRIGTMVLPLDPPGNGRNEHVRLVRFNVYRKN